MLPSLLGFVESFKKSCIIIDECTVEKERTEIEWNSKNFWDYEARFRIKHKKKKFISLYLYCFGPGHKLKRNGPKVSFWRTNWIRKFLYGLLFAKSKIFRLHAILHDSAGSVKSTTTKGPGYCYVAPSLPSSCFLGHVTGLVFCLFVKIFASSVYALFGY